MEFHTFGDKSGRAVMLIHGVLMPWNTWERQIDILKKDHYVIVLALDGHIEEYASEYISVDGEAEKIEQYVKTYLNDGLYAVCGLSMGGAVAYRLFERGNVDIKYLVLDGAPLVKMPSFVEKLMVHSYKSIIRKSKVRDKKTLESFKRDFLPEKYLAPYLKFADTMSEKTIENMIHSVCCGAADHGGGSRDTRILFMHGTKGNEVYSKKSADIVKRYYPDTVIKCFDGLKHAELAVYKPDEWLNEVLPFLNGQI